VLTENIPEKAKNFHFCF